MVYGKWVAAAAASAAFGVVLALGAPASWAQAEGKMVIVVNENGEQEGEEVTVEPGAVEGLKQAVAGRAATAMATAESKKVKVTYLGVVTSPTTEVLTSQLKLPEDTALVVEQVAAKSPAEAAGIKPNDVLIKLDDQLLINIEQLRVLVRMRKPGDVVRLTYVRAGIQAVAAATLSDEWESASIEILPGAWSSAGALRMVEDRAKLLSGNKFSGAGMMQIDDGIHTVTVDQKDGSKRARVVEKATGKVVFDGPIDTPEQRKGLPPVVAKLIESVQIAPHYGAFEMKPGPVEAPQPPAPAPAP